MPTKTLIAPASSPIKNPKSDMLAMLIIFMLMVSMAILLVIPWLPQYDPQIVQHNRYFPLANGQALTRVSVDGQGQAVGWDSENTVSIPAWSLFGDELPSALVSQLVTVLPDLVAQGLYPANTSLFRTHIRHLSRDGSTSDSDVFTLRQPQQDGVLALTLPGLDNLLLYNPPIDTTIRGADTTTTTQIGTLAGVYTYTMATAFKPISSWSTPFGGWIDCLRAEVDYTLNDAVKLVGEQFSTNYYCPLGGLVDQTSRSVAAGVSSRVYAITGLTDVYQTPLSQILPPQRPLAPRQTESDLETWSYRYFAAGAPDALQSATSIAPLYVPSPQPYILAAARAGPLIAIDAQQPERVIWQFQSGGSIYSQPAVDPDTGYLYFGSSDKHLYALSDDGIFLWRSPANDNIAAQPLIHQDLVVAVAEDGSVLAIDKGSGRQLWRLNMGSAVVASPAILSDKNVELTVIGSYGGLLCAVDSASGSQIWSIALDGAIQAPLHLDNATLYVGTSKSIYAISAGGVVLWSTPLLSALQSEVGLDMDYVYAVDAQGWLYAIERKSGRIAWRSDQADYLGPPIILSQAAGTDASPGIQLLVLSTAGVMNDITSQGQLIRQWSLNGDVADPSLASLTLGPSFGGGAIWLGDEHGTIFRLGPPLTPGQGK